VERIARLHGGTLALSTPPTAGSRRGSRCRSLTTRSPRLSRRRAPAQAAHETSTASRDARCMWSWTAKPIQRGHTRWPRHPSRARTATPDHCHRLAGASAIAPAMSGREDHAEHRASRVTRRGDARMSHQRDPELSRDAGAAAPRDGLGVDEHACDARDATSGPAGSGAQACRRAGSPSESRSEERARCARREVHSPRSRAHREHERRDDPPAATIRRHVGPACPPARRRTRHRRRPRAEPDGEQPNGATAIAIVDRRAVTRRRGVDDSPSAISASVGHGGPAGSSVLDADQSETAAPARMRPPRTAHDMSRTALLSDGLARRTSLLRAVQRRRSHSG